MRMKKREKTVCFGSRIRDKTRIKLSRIQKKSVILSPPMRLCSSLMWWISLFASTHRQNMRSELNKLSCADKQRSSRNFNPETFSKLKLQSEREKKGTVQIVCCRRRRRLMTGRRPVSSVVPALFPQRRVKCHRVRGQRSELFGVFGSSGGEKMWEKKHTR